MIWEFSTIPSLETHKGMSGATDLGIIAGSVPYVRPHYFAWWRSERTIGRPGSHGCLNLLLDDARFF